jgi:hypothetical protein
LADCAVDGEYTKDKNYGPMTKKEGKIEQFSASKFQNL